MLQIKNLYVEVGGDLILEDINLSIDEGEVMILFGPNGSGKTTLIKTILGFEGYKIRRGEIIFKNKVINNLSTSERANLGLGIMFQHPPKIYGVKLLQIAEYLCKDKENIEKLAKSLSLKAHLSRDINIDFSGGEMKRSELFQVILQNPDLLLLDEPESGVDIENISIMCKVLNKFLSNRKKSALIITHTGYILDYIEAKKGCVMIEGKLWCVGEPRRIFNTIKERGYEKCKECVWSRRI